MSRPPNVRGRCLDDRGRSVAGRDVGDDSVRAPGTRRRADRLLAAPPPRARRRRRRRPPRRARVAMPRPMPRLEPVTTRDFAGEPQIHGASLVAWPSTRILLARHGETDWNRIGRWQGHADPPLNETGGNRPRSSRSSSPATASPPSTRAISVARARRRRSSASGSVSQVVEDAALREIDVGSWSGLTRDEVRGAVSRGLRTLARR